MFAVEANSLERIVDYFAPRIPQEPAFKEKAKPPASWPTSGNIVLENLTARYSKTGAPVLNDLSLSIRSGEKVGVVGRTGGELSYLSSFFFFFSSRRLELTACVFFFSSR